MSDTFRPLDTDRAEQIRQALNRARNSAQGVVIDRESGQFQGVAPLNQPDPDKVNMVGKFDTHYAS